MSLLNRISYPNWPSDRKNSSESALRAQRAKSGEQKCQCFLLMVLKQYGTCVPWCSLRTLDMRNRVLQVRLAHACSCGMFFALFTVRPFARDLGVTLTFVLKVHISQRNDSARRNHTEGHGTTGILTLIWRPYEQPSFDTTLAHSCSESSGPGVELWALQSLKGCDSTLSVVWLSRQETVVIIIAVEGVTLLSPRVQRLGLEVSRSERTPPCIVLGFSFRS